MHIALLCHDLIHPLAVDLVKAFRAFHLKDRPDRKKYQLNIIKNRLILDVHQVEQQLIMGRCIILAEYLGVTGQTSLYAQSVCKLRQIPAVHFRMLYPFGAGSHKAHIALQNIEELRQLIDTHLSDDPSHLGDAGIILRGRNGAVPLGISFHAAELQDLKFLHILCMTFLPEKDRTAVFKFDTDRSDQHNRRQYDDKQQGQDDVHDSFFKQEKPVFILIIVFHQRRIQQMPYRTSRSQNIVYLRRIIKVLMASHA